LDKADIGCGDDSIDSATGIDIDLVIVLKGIRVSAFWCGRISKTEEDGSLEGDITPSAISRISEDVAVGKSDNGVSGQANIATTSCTFSDIGSDVTVTKQADVRSGDGDATSSRLSRRGFNRAIVGGK
jgi:hypothetical protein